MCVILNLQAALAVAIVNIQIPLLLGDVVNVLSQYTNGAPGNFMDDIKEPGLKLITMYVIQVRYGAAL